ncbi:MAG: penicillin-binding transpeptidase domain-containing protein, partial [Defluviitaleaceae bacterium]|nr:penicillin-binding transpeptidase domain-containing protein [Defluviitaleaceae bacterium]
ALLELTRIFERNHEDFVNDFPMTDEWPYAFTLGGSTPEIRQRREYRWKADMAVPNPETATAAESFLHLLEQFDLDADLSNADARRILNLRCMIFERRFRSAQIFVIATDVSMATVAAIEERNTFFTGVSIDVRTLREYPQGIYFSHMLGHTGIINAEELAANPDYAYDDVIGKAGLESSQEHLLRGESGTNVIEINPTTGRRTAALPEITPPVPGYNIFLTIDIEMQRRTYYILKDYLTEIAIRRIQSTDTREGRVTHQQIFNNLIRAGWIPIRGILESDPDSAAYSLRQYIMEHFPEATPLREDRDRIVSLLTDGIDAGQITPAMLFTTMVDMGILSDTNDFTARVMAGRGTPHSFIVEKLRMGELTPQMLNVDPATGSIVVVDVRTGAVLAAVSYPSYDNNRLANRIDAEYFYRINVDDPTIPMYNRPFREARAPGSTFKMITAVAGLETGVITPTSTIRDGVVFTRAGRPYASCMSRAGHGSIHVAQAISTSCNYFFFETAFRLGNNRLQRIDTLNAYMEFFGLNERAGVEVGELADTFNRERTPNIMASPSLKEFLHLRRDEFAPRSQWDWFDGDTIRTAIGQSDNNYTSAMMARYIAQIANNGMRFPLYMVDSVRNYRGEIVMQATPVPDETGLEISASTWEVVQQGMLQTTEGWGTATNQFRGFPIRVAGKTGTAEQIGTRLSHTSFGGYAPFDNPQVAVYVTVPFGDTRVMPAASTLIARDVIYAFLMPETEVEFAVAVNEIVR